MVALGTCLPALPVCGDPNRACGWPGFDSGERAGCFRRFQNSTTECMYANALNSMAGLTHGHRASVLAPHKRGIDVSYELRNTAFA